MPETGSDAEARRKIWALIQGIDVAMMVTEDGQGNLHGRPMHGVNREFAGVLWFFAHAEATVAGEAARDGRVLLTYADPRSHTYVTINGRASVVRDAAEQRRLWRDSLRAWLPGGAEDPKAMLIRVDCTAAQHWDRPSGSMLYAWEYVRALATGRPPQAGTTTAPAAETVRLTRGAG